MRKQKEEGKENEEKRRNEEKLRNEENEEKLVVKEQNEDEEHAVEEDLVNK